MTEVYVQVGARVPDLGLMETMPIGTVIENGSRQYTRNEEGYWVLNGTRYLSTQFRPPTMTVVSYPEGTVIKEPPVETIERYKWRFRDYALNAANNHGVSYEASRETLNELGTDLPIGRGVRTQDQSQWRRLPEGSLVFTGQPHLPATFAVYEKISTNTWQPRLGDAPMVNLVTVYRVGRDGTDQPEWLTRVCTDAASEIEAINEFKAQVWRLGWRLKKVQGWCSTYEAVLREFGITQAASRVASSQGVRVGERVAPEVAATLPMGSVLRWVSSTDQANWGLYVRCAASNVAGTMKIGGHGNCSARNYHSSMEVISIATAQFPQWIWDYHTATAHVFFDALVPGVQFSNHGDPEGSPQYVKALDGRIETRVGDTIPDTGRWRIDDFGDTPSIIIHTYPEVSFT